MGGPYAPTTAAVGGVPSKIPDIPLSSVFLVLFAAAGAANMALFLRNKSHGRFFLFNGMLFGFCLIRVVTFVMRIVWACYPQDVQIAIAGQIFPYAGTILLYIINLAFAWRLLRAAHSRWAWKMPITVLFRSLFALIPITLVMLIIVIVQQFYTMNPNTHRIDRDIQLYGSTYFVVVSAVPLIIVLITLIPFKTHPQHDFGEGSWWSKIIILTIGTVLSCIVAGFRAGTSWETPRSKNNPAWYHSEAAFWIFNFVPEYLTVLLYLVTRVDKRFWVVPRKQRVEHELGETHQTKTSRMSDSDESLPEQPNSETEGMSKESWA